MSEDSAASTTPEALEIYVGSFSSPSYGLWWDGSKLVYESFVAGYEDRQQTYIKPSDAQWRRFWRTMDDIDVWSWQKRYARRAHAQPDQVVRDGTHWSLTLRCAGRSVESAGEDAGPGARDLGKSAQFDAFSEAVSRLTGGYRFS